MDTYYICNFVISSSLNVCSLQNFGFVIPGNLKTACLLQTVYDNEKENWRILTNEEI